MTKYIFVCGGVMSGIGKGITAASIGKILQSKGYSVTNIKIDPYLNVDAGTMNPIEHGEVFVTQDGLECDQDIGNYERFTGQEMFSFNYMTAGQVYQTVIAKERNLEYGGKCVESIPHITQEIIDRIELAAKKTKADFVITEIGGTVGELQNSLFLEASRILKMTKKKKFKTEQVIFVLVTYLPVPKMLGEMKTKPTQTAVKELNSFGIQPDFIIARSEYPLDDLRKEKIAIFCNVDASHTISAPDIKSIYKVPINFEAEEIGNKILKCFKMKSSKKDMHDWRKMVDVIENQKQSVKIGIVGKYFVSGKFTLLDSYISVIEAVKHACWANNKISEISWLNAESYQESDDNLKELDNFDAIIVPGGFGNRGIEGKIKALQYCRTKKIPTLGLCLGMQLMTVEFARNVCGLKNANSTEMDAKTPHPVIHIMKEQEINLKEKKMGGTMRLGAYDCAIKKGTVAFSCYQNEKISERHRHRYEFNNDYMEKLGSKGMTFSGINPQRNLVEISEIADHPFYLGCQFHPEFKSRPVYGHPLFNGLIKAGIKKKQAKKH